jgi:methylated-DNA-[protein]-cysteine S-methyltransferase
MVEVLRFYVDRTDTPIGELVVIADSKGILRGVGFADHEERLLQQLGQHYSEIGLTFEPKRNPSGLTSVLTGYFEGDLRAIDGLPVQTGGTSFQNAVWKALREIPCGTTWSYSELAQRIGRPSAVRAVGLANGANPISIVVPCHRVIGANGTLTGYGGGIERKRWLLDHEAAARSAPRLPFTF